MGFNSGFKGLNTELNLICNLLALLGARHILHIRRIRVNKKREVSSLRTWKSSVEDSTFLI